MKICWAICCCGIFFTILMSYAMFQALRLHQGGRQAGPWILITNLLNIKTTIHILGEVKIHEYKYKFMISKFHKTLSIQTNPVTQYLTVSLSNTTLQFFSVENVPFHQERIFTEKKSQINGVPDSRNYPKDFGNPSPSTLRGLWYLTSSLLTQIKPRRSFNSKKNEDSVKRYLILVFDHKTLLFIRFVLKKRTH